MARLLLLTSFVFTSSKPLTRRRYFAHVPLCVLVVSLLALPISGASGAILTLQGVWPASGRGTYAHAMHVVGQRAYVLTYPGGVGILDSSDPSNPIALGRYPGWGRDIQVIENMIYLTVSHGFEIIDASDPDAPVRLSSYRADDTPWGLYVADNHVYLIANGHVEIIDVSDLTNPIRVGTYTPASFPVAVHAVGQFVYLGTAETGLQILDVSGDPAAPVLVGTYETDETEAGLGSIDVVGHLAFWGVGKLGLRIIDVSDPAQPLRLANYDTSDSAVSVQIVGDIAYLADGPGGLIILDVSDASKPVRIGSLQTGRAVRKAQVVGSLAYLVTTVPYGVGDGLQIVDVSDPTNPSPLSSYATPSRPEGIQVVGNLAYVTTFVSGLQIINVNDPTNPVLVGDYLTRETTTGVQVRGDLAYLVSHGLLILDVSDPTNPVRIGSCTNRFGSPYGGIELVGNIAYAAAYPFLEIFDVSDPANPALLESRIPLSKSTTDVGVTSIALNEGLVYATTRLGGLEIFSIGSDVTQSIRFPRSSTVVFPRPPLALETFASSGLTTSYSLLSGPATLEGNELIINDVGQVTIRGEQGGNELFLPTAEEYSLNVIRADEIEVSLEPLQFLEDGSLRLEARVEPAVTLRLESSTDLFDWVVVDSEVGSLSHTRPSYSIRNQEFYRVVAE